MNATVTPETLEVSAAQVRDRFATARARGLRAKDAAEAIGLSEAAVAAAHTGSHEQPMQVQVLRNEWIEILSALQPCGNVMGLTRNASVVHEKDGVYQGFSQEGPIGICNNDDIDLRLFFMHWYVGFAVTEPGRQGQTMHSLQFYDASGVAVHKVYARPETDQAAWNAVVERFASTSQAPAFTPAAARVSPKLDAEIDATGLRDAWAGMQDTHEFFGMLKKFGCERQQSFRLTQGEFCEPLQTQVATALLERAAAIALPIMVFVGSKGCIQIHSGPVHNIRPMSSEGGVEWINVLDPGFNLHLRNDRITNAWLVRKPTSDGIVTSVELFDGTGDVVAMFFGVRKPGQVELAQWRELAEQLPRLLPQQA